MQKLYVGQQIDNRLSNNAGAVPEKKLRVVLFFKRGCHTPKASSIV